MGTIIGIGTSIPTQSSFSWSSYWSSRLPYFALPETGVSLMVGQEVTIYGDSLINLPLGRATDDLRVTYTCDIGTVSGNNITFNPVEGNIGNHSLRMVFKNGGYTIADETITISVYALATAGVKKILMIGDSLMASGSGYYHTKLDAALPNTALTFLGSKGTTTKHEGISGYSWDTFATNSESPFIKAGVLDIAAYFTDNTIEKPDYVYIMLGVNDVFGSSAIAGNGLTDAEITTILNSAKTLIDGFLAYDANLKIILGIPTLTGITNVAWNIDYDETVYSQDLYINNIHKYRAAFITEFANGSYNARVDCSYEAISLSRTTGYAELANGGVHPDQSGYEQLGTALALRLNKEINTDLENAFITTWNTENAGSATKTIVLPITQDLVDIVIDWGDGTTEHKSGTPGNVTHVYATAGIKTVIISGIFKGMQFMGIGDKLKILSIENWGNGVWLDMQSAFYGCENLVGNYTDSPDTSQVEIFYYTFADCKKFNSPVNFNTEKATNMAGMFYQATMFNQSVSSFNTSKVTTMNSMFLSSAFNQSVANFNTELCTDMYGMFYDTPFNQSLAHFDVGAVTAMDLITYYSAFSTANYDALLIAWATQTVQPTLTVRFGSVKYSAGAAATARGVLTSAPNSWTITDGGQA